MMNTRIKYGVLTILFVASLFVSWQKKTSEERAIASNTAKIDDLTKTFKEAINQPVAVINQDTVKKVAAKYVLELKDFDTLHVDSSGKVILVPKQMKLVEQINIKKPIKKIPEKKPPVKKK